MKPYGPWKIKQTHDIYRDDFVRLWVDDVIRPDGEDGQHVVVSIKPGVCVLAIDGADRVHLTREFHYGVGRDSIEAVSGGIETDEDPLQTARRELEEELGLRADRWELVTVIDPFTTIMVSPTRIYFARDLTAGDNCPEGTESIEPVVVSLDEAVASVVAGEITHAPTCIAILLAHRAKDA